MKLIADSLRGRSVPAQARPRPVRDGVITLLIAVLAVYLLLAGVPFVGAEGTIVRAELEGRNALEPGDPVRVGGVDVGEVEAVELSRSGRTSIVALRLSDNDLVVKRDAQAHVYWRTLLAGSFYVELEPGSRSAPGLGDSVIPLSRTSAQTEFDDLFQPYDGPTRRNQQGIYRELRRALADPQSAGELIDTLHPTMSVVDRGLEPLQGRESDDLRRLVTSTGRFAAALGRSPRQLSGFVADANATLGVMARRREDLGRMIDVSPPMMDATVRTMRHMLSSSLDRLDALATDLRPAARALGPAAAASEPALREADAFLRESKPLLRVTGPMFERLRGASRTGVPLIDELDPTLLRLNETLIPWLLERDPDSDRPTYQMIGPTLSVTGAITSEFDNNGYWLRFPAQGDERSLGSSPCQTFFTDPSEEEKVRCETLGDILPGLIPTGGGDGG